MSETPGRRRGNSMANVKRRGSTYTYYVYLTDADGRRRQHSKGGFRTQRAAEDARIEALSALANGSYVRASASPSPTSSPTSGSPSVSHPSSRTARGTPTTATSGCT